MNFRLFFLRLKDNTDKCKQKQQEKSLIRAKNSGKGDDNYFDERIDLFGVKFDENLVKSVNESFFGFESIFDT